MPTRSEKEHYHRGYLDGLEAYAWSKDGKQYVGTAGRTLAEAKAKARETYNYHPEKTITPFEEE